MTHHFTFSVRRAAVAVAAGLVLGFGAMSSAAAIDLAPGACAGGHAGVSNTPAGTADTPDGLRCAVEPGAGTSSSVRHSGPLPGDAGSATVEVFVPVVAE